MNFLFLHSNISLLLHSTGISKEYGLILVSRQKLFSNFIRTTPRSKVHKVGLEVQANFWNYESSLKLNFGIFDENGNEKSGCEIVAHLKQVLIRYTWNAHSKIEDNTTCIEEVRLKPIAQGIILIPALR